MTNLNDLPPTPMSKPASGAFSLVLPSFTFPDVGTLQFMMDMERRAQDMVGEKVKGLMEPGMSLVGATGQPMQSTAIALNNKLTTYLHELASLPTLADEWASASESKNILAGVVSPTSYQIAYMIYMEFGRVLATKARDFIQVMDAVIIMGMNAMHHQELPFEAYRRSFKPKAEEGIIPILGTEEKFNDRMKVVQDLLWQFMSLKGLMTATADGSVPVLTMNGVNVLNHLCAVLGSTESMRQQGPELVKATMVGNPETKTSTQIAADLTAPSTATEG